MSIDFSIVIPTYNSEKFLSETIESIKIQDRSIKIELIFSDGGSKDSTLKIIEKLDQDNLSKIVLHDQVGMTVALNQGFKRAQGKYLSYLNSDDKLNSNALLSIKKNFEENNNYEWIIGLCDNFGNKKILNRIINYYKALLLKKLNFNLLCINNVISQPSVFWKKSFFDSIGNFNEKLKFNMDYDMWIRMIIVSDPLKLQRNMSYFRRHNESLSHKNSFKQFCEKYKTMKKYNRNILIHLVHLSLSSLILLIYKTTNY